MASNPINFNAGRPVADAKYFNTLGQTPGSTSQNPGMATSTTNPLSQSAVGPLSALDNSDYNFNGLQYPKDLATSTKRGHWINFYINVATKSIEQGIGLSSMTSYSSGAGLGIVQGFTSTTTNAQGVSTTTVNGGLTGRTGINQAAAYPNPTGVNPINGAQQSFSVRQTKRINQAISLYMPETVNVTYNANWQSESLTEASGALGKFGSLGGSISEAIMGTYNSNKTASGLSGQIAESLAGVLGKSGLTGPGAVDFALFSQGYALNPQLEVLFKGTEMRTFQFDFMFSPKDEGECQAALDIIKTLRFHQAPEVNTGSVGRFFIPPSEFDIDFMVNGSKNPNINQIGTCVLTGMNVDYAPNGPSFFGNKPGMPTSMRLTLQFMETEIVTKNLVKDQNY